MNTLITLIIRHVITALGVQGLVSSEETNQIGGAVAVIAGIGWSIYQKKQSGVPIVGKTDPKVPLVIIAALLAVIAPGCAKFSGVSERHYQGTNLVSEVVRFRGYTLFDAKAELAKAKANQTRTTQSVGVDASQQESTGKSVVDAIEKVGEAVPNIIKKSVVPIP